MDHLAKVNEAYVKFFTSDPKPVRCLIPLCITITNSDVRHGHAWRLQHYHLVQNWRLSAWQLSTKHTCYLSVICIMSMLPKAKHQVK